jgi:perosamine synthetase
MIPLIKTFLPPREVLLPRLEEVLYSGYIAQGAQVKEFDNELAELISNPYTLSLNSGTSSLQLSMILAGVENGDEVISTAMTAEPTNTSILSLGAKVVFADVEPKTGLICPVSIMNSITEKTKAIIVVHYAGMVCNLEQIYKIGLEYNLPIIEDCAHSFMAKYDGSIIGKKSQYACFSFQAIKHMTTIDGGMITLSNESDYLRAKSLRWFGLSKDIPRNKNIITEAGHKFNMNDVNATIGRVQLEYLNHNVKQYIHNGQFFDEKLNNISGVELIQYHNNTSPSYWLYTMLVENRDEFVRAMADKGISASTLHVRNDKHNCFNSKKLLPGLDFFSSRYVHIPCGWWLDDEKRETIVSAIKQGW